MAAAAAAAQRWSWQSSCTALPGQGARAATQRTAAQLAWWVVVAAGWPCGQLRACVCPLAVAVAVAVAIAIAAVGEAEAAGRAEAGAPACRLPTPRRCWSTRSSGTTGTSTTGYTMRPRRRRPAPVPGQWEQQQQQPMGSIPHSTLRATGLAGRPPTASGPRGSSLQAAGSSPAPLVVEARGSILGPAVGHGSRAVQQAGALRGPVAATAALARGSGLRLGLELELGLGSDPRLERSTVAVWPIAAALARVLLAPHSASASGNGSRAWRLRCAGPEAAQLAGEDPGYTRKTPNPARASKRR